MLCSLLFFRLRLPASFRYIYPGKLYSLHSVSDYVLLRHIVFIAAFGADPSAGLGGETFLNVEKSATVIAEPEDVLFLVFHRNGVAAVRTLPHFSFRTEISIGATAGRAVHPVFHASIHTVPPFDMLILKSGESILCFAVRANNEFTVGPDFRGASASCTFMKHYGDPLLS